APEGFRILEIIEVIEVVVVLVLVIAVGVAAEALDRAVLLPIDLVEVLDSRGLHRLGTLAEHLFELTLLIAQALGLLLAPQPKEDRPATFLRERDAKVLREHQNGDEIADGLSARARAREELVERREHVARLFEPRDDVRDVLLERAILDHHLVRHAAPDRDLHAVERREEIPHRQVAEEDGRLLLLAGWKIHRRAVVTLSMPIEPAFEENRPLLEPLVLEELAHEIEPRVVELLLVLLEDLPRQEELRLDLHETRGHDEELAARVRIDVLEDLEIELILLDEPGDRDIEDIDLLFLDEIEEEIERACVGLESSPEL